MNPLFEEPHDGGTRRTIRGSLLYLWDGLVGDIWVDLHGTRHEAHEALRRGEPVLVSEEALRSRVGANRQDEVPATTSGWLRLTNANDLEEAEAP